MSVDLISSENRTRAAEALFASNLQPSDRPTPAQVDKAILASLNAFGGAAGCACRMATEYGEHPEAAAARMRWALACICPPAASLES